MHASPAQPVEEDHAEVENSWDHADILLEVIDDSPVRLAGEDKHAHIAATHSNTDHRSQITDHCLAGC